MWQRAPRVQKVLYSQTTRDCWSFIFQQYFNVCIFHWYCFCFSFLFVCSLTYLLPQKVQQWFGDSRLRVQAARLSADKFKKTRFEARRKTLAGRILLCLRRWVQNDRQASEPPNEQARLVPGLDHVLIKAPGCGTNFKRLACYIFRSTPF